VLWATLLSPPVLLLLDLISSLTITMAPMTEILSETPPQTYCNGQKKGTSMAPKLSGLSLHVMGAGISNSLQVFHTQTPYSFPDPQTSIWTLTMHVSVSCAGGCPHCFPPPRPTTPEMAPIDFELLLYVIY